MDKSILPGMSKKAFDIPWPFGKKSKKKKKTQPGAMDDNAKKRMQDRNDALKRAAE